MKCKGCCDYEEYPGGKWRCLRLYAEMDTDCLLRVAVVELIGVRLAVRELIEATKEPVEDWKKGYEEEDAG